MRGVDAHTDYDMLADGYDGKKANFPLVRASDDLSLSIVVRFVMDIKEKKNKIYVKVDNQFEKRAQVKGSYEYLCENPYMSSFPIGETEIGETEQRVAF